MVGPEPRVVVDSGVFPYRQHSLCGLLVDLEKGSARCFRDECLRSCFNRTSAGDADRTFRLVALLFSFENLGVHGRFMT